MSLDLPFDNSYARLPEQFYTRMSPTPVSTPGLIRLNAPLAQRLGIDRELGNVSDKDLRKAAAKLADWRFSPNGTEGFAKAEVTIGGISTADLSSQTMEAKRVPGLYAIGEAVDVTGWLGGYNFQWAWASGVAAANAIAQSQEG